jgi:hypothetical protein
MYAGAPTQAPHAPTLLAVAGRAGVRAGSQIPRVTDFKENPVGLGTILLVVLILILIGIVPTWPHSRSWGYGPSGAVGLVVVIIVVMLLMGRI